MEEAASQSQAATDWLVVRTEWCSEYVRYRVKSELNIGTYFYEDYANNEKLLYFLTVTKLNNFIYRGYKFCYIV